MAEWNVQTPDLSSQIASLTALAKEHGQSAASNKVGRPDPSQNGKTLNAQVGQPYHPVMRGDAANEKYWRDMGLGEHVPLSLISTESGGNFGAYNSEKGAGGLIGHGGIFQMGQARLGEAIAAGAIPQMTMEQFLQSPDAQIASANWHFQDIEDRIFSNGLDQYIGQNIGGVGVTMDAMKAMAHLGGFRGMFKYLGSGGSHNPADAYGTSLQKYGRIHG